MKKSLKLLISFHQIFFLFYFPQLILFNSLSCSSYIFFSNFLRILLFFINSLYHVAVNFRDTSFEFYVLKMKFSSLFSWKVISMFLIIFLSRTELYQDIVFRSKFLFLLCLTQNYAAGIRKHYCIYSTHIQHSS